MSRTASRLGSLLLGTCCLLGIRATAQTLEEQARAARQRMVEQDLISAGISHPRVLEVMRAVPRHEFVPASQQRLAYLDMALPIGSSQTISPPFVVALMTEKLDPQPTDRVLEIGTGSGYQAAVLAELVAEVYTIEILPELGKRADATLQRLGYRNVQVKIGDGYEGWPEHAPFDKIIVTCSPEQVPQPLVEQLREGGRMIVPVGERYQQTLYLFTKRNGKLQATALEPTMFVPMLGEAESQRSVAYDDTRPALVNGGFEAATLHADRPDGWYYLRQARLAEEEGAPEGAKLLVIRNGQPGRQAQALQAFGIDGSRVPALEVSLWVRARRAQRGRSEAETPGLALVFFDEHRAPCGKGEMGPWVGSFEWTRKRKRIAVPESARMAVLAIGLAGGTGELAFDAVAVAPAE